MSANVQESQWFSMEHFVVEAARMVHSPSPRRLPSMRTPLPVAEPSLETSTLNQASPSTPPSPSEARERRVGGGGGGLGVLPPELPAPPVPPALRSASVQRPLWSPCPSWADQAERETSLVLASSGLPGGKWQMVMRSSSPATTPATATRARSPEARKAKCAAMEGSSPPGWRRLETRGSQDKPSST